MKLCGLWTSASFNILLLRVTTQVCTQKTTSNYRSQVDQSHATHICRKPHSSHSENASPFRWPKTHPLSLPADHPASNDWFRLASIWRYTASAKLPKIPINWNWKNSKCQFFFWDMISYDLRVNIVKCKTYENSCCKHDARQLMAVFELPQSHLPWHCWRWLYMILPEARSNNPFTAKWKQSVSVPKKRSHKQRLGRWVYQTRLYYHDTVYDL